MLLGCCRAVLSRYPARLALLLSRLPHGQTKPRATICRKKFLSARWSDGVFARTTHDCFRSGGRKERWPLDVSPTRHPCSSAAFTKRLVSVSTWTFHLFLTSSVFLHGVDSILYHERRQPFISVAVSVLVETVGDPIADQTPLDRRRSRVPSTSSAATTFATRDGDWDGTLFSRTHTVAPGAWR